jgi:hypothetical protein
MSWVMRIIPGFRRFAQLSLPVRIALMTFVFLFIVAGAGVIKYYLMPPNEVEPRTWWVWVVLPLLLMVVIPLVVYRLVKLLLEKPVALFPDLERAWDIGINGLQNQQIPIRSVPLFLIFGAENAKQVSELMEAVQIETPIKPPEGEELPLLWYANPNAIFLFVNGCSSLSKLASKRKDASPIRRVSYAAGVAPISRTIDASDDSMPRIQPLPGGGISAKPAYRPSRPAMPMVSQGTLVSDAPSPIIDQRIEADANRPPTSAQLRLTSDEGNHQSRRLEYVCNLLLTARRPVCGLNGVLVMASFEVVETNSSETQKAVQTDLAILRDRLAVRCPVTLVMSEMERVEGFLELVKRVGDDHANEGRFGKGCSVWGDPQANRLDGVAAHAIGAFEDWIYRLLQREDSLRRVHNELLISLLCRTRGSFADAFRAFVRNGFGYDPQTQPELSRSQLLFAGCYFAATGRDADGQAFIKSVFAKLIENQGELEWAPKARQEDQLFQASANLITLIGLLAILAILVGLVWR